MKAFNYRARTANSTPISGVIEANSQQEAIEKLREGGMIVETIEATGSGREVSLELGSRAKDKNLAIMCNQLAIILQAGMPIVRSLELVSAQTEDKALKAVLSNVADDVSAGYGLADSFAKHGKNLPDTFIESVRTGEVSGRLEQVFFRMASYYNKTNKNRSKVRAALIYPAFVLALAVIVVGIIMVFAVPQFTSAFASMNMELPAITKFLIASSEWWTRNFIVVIAVIAILIIAYNLLQKNSAFRLATSKLALRIPVLGRIARMDGASQYASTMSMMMDAGLPVISAVDVTSRALGNDYMADALASTKIDLEAGKPLATCLQKSDAFPELMVEMTGIGEQTGSLERTLEVMADYYDNETEVATSRALAIMEPLMIVILAVIVGGILLAVYLPIFSLYGGMGASI